MSKEECKKTMVAVTSQALESVGFCRHFPRAIVFVPSKYNGLGITHIHSIQEIEHLKTLINHTARNTYKGLLYRADLENLIVEAGLGMNILNLPYSELSPLTTKSLLKAAWRFCSSNQFQLQHDTSIPSF